MISIGNLTKLEIAVEGRIYQFICDPNSPVQHAKEAILKFLGHCLEIEKASQPENTQCERVAQEIQAHETEEHK